MKPAILDPLPVKSLDWDSLSEVRQKAHAALARYDELLQSVPEPDLFLTLLRRQEAEFSSRIEAIWASVEDVLTYEAHPQRRVSRYEDIQDVRNYQQALEEAGTRMKTSLLSLNMIRDIHRALMASRRNRYLSPGKFRRRLVWIGTRGSTLETARYVPPAPEHLAPLLDNLERYINGRERDVLVQAGIVHAQFESIHPFLDGNGRVGRILIPLVVYQHGALCTPALYISVYLEVHRWEYYEGLRQLQANGEWEAWLTFFLRAVAFQTQQNARQIVEMRNLYAELQKKAAQHIRSSYVTPTLEYIFRHPVFSLPQIAQALEADPQTIAPVIGQLVEIGVLGKQQTTSDPQSATYTCEALLRIVRGQSDDAAHS